MDLKSLLEKMTMERAQMPAMLYIRCTDRERDVINAAAHHANTSMSSFIRTVAVAAATELLAIPEDGEVSDVRV